MKNDKLGIAIIILLIIIICFVTFFLSSTTKDVIYEYALNNEIYSSNKCFYKDDAYCMKGSEIIAVDNYYEKN